MIVEQDEVSGAKYFALVDDAEVARSVHLDQTLMVDVDAFEHPVGVELASPHIDAQEAWHRLLTAFPDLKLAFPDPWSLERT